MLNTVFYSLINMSIIASMIGLLLLVLRRIQPVPRTVIYWSWTLVLLKFIIPFTITSRFSILNFTGPLVKKVVTLPDMKERSINLSIANSIGAADTYFPVTYKTAQLETIFSIAAWVWLIGLVCLVAFSGVMYLITCSRLKSASTALKVQGMNNTANGSSSIDKSVKDFSEFSPKAAATVYTCELIDTPMVQGVFRQRILIPKDCLVNPGIKYIISHENVHVQRKDNLFKIVFFLISCLHWYNPLIWVFLNKFYEDMELTCDLGAVKGLTADERKAYAQTLLAVGTEQQYLVISAYGGSNIGKRVINVLNYKKITVFSLIIMLTFVTAAAVVFLTNPIK